MSFEKIKNNLEEIYKIMAKSEWYWYNLADDYQTKYAFSSDYDKSYKKTYHEKGAQCKKDLNKIKNIEFPNTKEEIGLFLDKVIKIIDSSSVPIKDKHDIKILINELLKS